MKELAARKGQDVADYAGALLEQDVKKEKHLFEEDEDPHALERAIELMKNRTTEEIEDVRKKMFANSKQPRPLPEGKNLFDVICGKWPGDETDDEITEALRKIS